MLRPVLTALAALAAAALSTPDARALPSAALPAQVVPLEQTAALASYPMVDVKKATTHDDRTGATTWRVVQGTGNCCENYLAATAGGRLLDFGGSFVNYTDDQGETWHQVRPLTPLVNGEGAIVVAPNGDVVAVGWDPYSGWKDPAFYSTDGLTYTDASSAFLDETSSGPVEGYLTTAADPTFDWIQPNTGSGMTALGAGAALASGELTSSSGLLDPAALAWRAFTFPGGASPQGLHQIDSAGRIDNVMPTGTGFDFRVSPDGGRSWNATSAALPAGFSIDQIDFPVNGALGVAAVAIHALDSATGNDQDFACKFTIAGGTPFLQRRYSIGKGDAGSAAGVGNSVRMDFQTIAILPDGRLALSFLDSTTHFPSPTTGTEKQRLPPLAVCPYRKLVVCSSDGERIQPRRHARRRLDAEHGSDHLRNGDHARHLLRAVSLTEWFAFRPAAASVPSPRARASTASRCRRRRDAAGR